MINLGHDWLHSLLPHVLAKINRVHFGLLRPHELVYMAANGTLPREPEMAPLHDTIREATPKIQASAHLPHAPTSQVPLQSFP